MKKLLLMTMCACFALAQEKPKETPPPKPTPLNESERLALMETQREVLIAQNNLSTSMVSYYEAQAKAKAASEKFNQEYEAALKKAGCKLDSTFKCQAEQKPAAK